MPSRLRIYIQPNSCVYGFNCYFGVQIKKYQSGSDTSKNLFAQLNMAQQSNFDKMKALFKSETGLDWKDNVNTYIAYYQAKMIEQFLHGYYAVHKLST